MAPMTRRAFGVLASLFPWLFGKKAEAETFVLGVQHVGEAEPSIEGVGKSLKETEFKTWTQSMGAFEPKRNPIVPHEPIEVSALSVEKQVYIFNVSPFRFLQEMGSYGSFVILPVAEVKCLNGKTVSATVAGPLVIPGLPSECYGDKRIYHRSLTGKSAGMDFALEVIGAGLMCHKNNDLRRYGVFISEHREPLAEEIEAAQLRLKATAEEQLDWATKYYQSDLEAKGEYARAKAQIAGMNQSITDPEKWLPNPSFPYIRFVPNERLYTFARILGKTKADCPWMEDNS